MEFVRVDKQGRVILPKKIREEFDTRQFAVEKEEERLVFIPVKSLRQAAGMLPGINMQKYWREHRKEK